MGQARNSTTNHDEGYIAVDNGNPIHTYIYNDQSHTRLEGDKQEEPLVTHTSRNIAPIDQTLNIQLLQKETHHNRRKSNVFRIKSTVDNQGMLGSLQS